MDTLKFFLDENGQQDESSSSSCVPVCGAFGEGEVASIGTVSALHAYTAALAVFRTAGTAGGLASIPMGSTDRGRHYGGELEGSLQENLNTMIEKAKEEKAEGVPLNTALMPGCSSDFHIFEPRYRLLASICHSKGEPFGLMASDGKGIGTLCSIVDYA